MASSHIRNEEDEDEFLNNDKVVSIINLLTKFKIKLWEMPIDQENNTQLDDLVMKLSDESGVMENEVKEIVIKLQKHSIRKLESNKRYTKDGIAELSLRVIGNNNSIKPKTFKDSIEVSIDLTGKELKQHIIEKFNFNCDNLKLIYNGKLINDESQLKMQELKNHSTIMVMCIYEKLGSEIVNENSEDYKLISDIKDAVNLLSENKIRQRDENLNHFTLKNQNGISIDVSKEDERALTAAIILHEKGKSLIKSKEYLKALIILADADNEFKNCTNRSLLERIDNYALLNLDIVWCYLCMQNLHDLKNAEERLSLCEKCLEKCYGADLERLVLLQQGNVNKYTPIFVRLNLLKGILMYHKGKKKECRQYLDAANNKLQSNVVDEDKMVQVMSMGFTSTQARLALRSTNGNIDAAIEQIIKKKEREKEAEKVEKEKRFAKRLEEKYGLTIKDAKPINIKTLKDIIQFGYTEKQAAQALIQSNNDFNLALDILQSQNPDEEMDTKPPKSTITTADLPPVISDDLLSQMTGMGYDIELCKLCLEAFNCNLQKSIEYFLSKAALLQNWNGADMLKHELRNMIEHNKNLKKSNTSSTSTESASASAGNEEAARRQHAEELIADLAKEMPEDDEAYLDLNLDEDLLFINKYYSLLGI